MPWTSILRTAIATGVRIPANDRVIRAIALAPSACSIPDGAVDEIAAIRTIQGE